MPPALEEVLYQFLAQGYTIDLYEVHLASYFALIIDHNRVLGDVAWRSAIDEPDMAARGLSIALYVKTRMPEPISR